MARIIVGTGRAEGMRVEQIVTEGEYEKGRLVGISGHWEDGAALMWSTEMFRLGLTPCDDVQWNKLTDSKGIQVQGTQKSIIGGIWLKWKKPAPIDDNGLYVKNKKDVAPVEAPDTAKNLRGVIGGLVSAAGQAAKNRIITAAAEAKKNLVVAADERARNERDRLERDGGGTIALRLANMVEAATKIAREHVENKPEPIQDQHIQSETDGKDGDALTYGEHQRHLDPASRDNPCESDADAIQPPPEPAAPQDASREDRSPAENEAAVAGVKAALDGAGACVLPFALLFEWTDGFSTQRRIGGGAFGDVYEATPHALPRLAVKRLSTDVRMQGTEDDMAAALACIRREVTVLGAFRHPNIIRLLGYTDAAGTAAAGAATAAHGRAELCLAYELAPRGGLDSSLRSDDTAADLTWRVRVRIAAGVARALNFMHCHDPAGPAFHRDVKSANVALMLDLTPKLIDCGLAKYAPDGRAGAGTVLSASGARLGTPGYKCPAYERTGVFTARSEVFSYGVLLLELLTGRLQTDTDLCAEFVEGDGDILAALDGRAGAWDPACAAGAAGLARESVAPLARRLGAMMTALRRAAELEARFCARTREEDGLARQVAELQAGLEALRAQQLLAERAERAAAAAAAAAARRTCRVCFDDVEGAPPPGIDCPAQGAEHFVCGGCFGLEVREQASPGARGAFAASGARAVCRLCLPARTAYADGALARALDDDGFALYRRAVVEASTAAVYQEEEARLQRCIAEVRAEAARDGAGERARRHRLHIAEHILCLHCPRCGQAFVDFAGCFALTCSRCACGFCAYCLADCGDDAHAHVAACAFNAAPGHDVFGTPELFQQAQNERRARALAAYLAEHVPDEAERAEVRASIAGELAGLGMAA